MSFLQKNIGIGCLFFIPKESNDSITFTGKDYMEWVGELLYTNEAVTDLNIEYIDEFEEHKFKFDPVMLEKTPSSFMCGTHLCDISFNLEIPSTFDGRMKDKNLNVDIYIIYNYYSVVTYCALNTDTMVSPSTAVNLSRRYLVENTNDSESNFRIDFLGPSPFHGDFYLYKGKNQNSKNIAKGLYFNKQNSFGYDRYDFYYDEKIYTSTESALKYFFKTTAQQLQHYYYTVTEKNKYISEWHNIYYKCLNISNRLNRNYSTLQTIKDSQELNKLTTKSIEAEIDKTIAENTIYDNLDQDKYPTVLIFKTETISELNETRQHDIETLKQYINSIKDCKTKNIDRVVNAIIGLSAGAIGAIITWALSIPAPK